MEKETEIAEVDLVVLAEQLGRVPRGVVEIAARCKCGRPTVVKTSPRLPDGTPFPTTFCLTHPGAVKAASRLEAVGQMKIFTEQIAEDDELAAAMEVAHQHYLEQRYLLEDVPEIHGISAGGMPNRVKCLHVMLGHSLAAGPGVNPIGDKVIELIAGDWQPTVCSC